MDLKDKFIKYSGDFFKHTLSEENFEKIVFGTLARIFPVKSAYIFFINADELELRYSYLPDEDLAVYNKDFSNTNTLVNNLCIEEIPFAKLVLSLNEAPTDEIREVFLAVSSIVGNLIKDLEMSLILKMQVEALQEGMDEVNKAYKVIKNQNKKIISAEKAKREFFASVSHQLRSPLNSIIGFADMLDKGFTGSLNNSQKTLVRDIKIASIKQLEMVNEVLDISKIEAKSIKLFKKIFSVKMNITEVLNILSPLYNEKSIFVTSNVPDHLELYGDYQKMQQVFFNLLSNAIKFTPKNGCITISAEREKKNVKISVKDNGIGIKPEFHKKIFKKYEQIAEGTGASTGLGLTIVKEIIKLHHGKIYVKSEEGYGAEFIITIPVG